MVACWHYLQKILFVQDAVFGKVNASVYTNKNLNKQCCAVRLPVDRERN